MAAALASLYAADDGGQIAGQNAHRRSPEEGADWSGGGSAIVGAMFGECFLVGEFLPTPTM